MQFIVEHQADILVAFLGGVFATAAIALVPYIRRLPSLRLPGWAWGGVGGFILIWSVMSHIEVRTFDLVADKNYLEETVALDGKKFIGCKFNSCLLEFDGRKPFVMKGCGGTGDKWVFGGSAELVIKALRSMYADPSVKPMLSGLLDK